MDAEVSAAFQALNDKIDAVPKSIWGYILKNKSSAGDNVAAQNTRVIRVINSIEGKTSLGELGVLGKLRTLLGLQK